MTEGWGIIKGNSLAIWQAMVDTTVDRLEIDVAVLGLSKLVINYYLNLSLFLYNHLVNEVFHALLSKCTILFTVILF